MQMAESIAFNYFKMLKNKYKYILDQLPNKSSFLFVDNISLLNDDEVTGDYTLKEDAFFYEDHFAGNPVTPGSIIIEIMAQIGLVVLGIYLTTRQQSGLSNTEDGRLFPLLTSTDVSFYKMVLPGEKVTIISKKQYFRFGKLKCYVEMHNVSEEIIAKGMISGMIKQFRHTK
jgi:3-hydroxyacyl-[acyl-carrier-protein] dehydratase